MNEKPNAAPCEHRRQGWSVNMRHGSCQDCGVELGEPRAPNLPDSETRESKAIMALVDSLISNARASANCGHGLASMGYERDFLADAATIRTAFERVIQERDAAIRQIAIENKCQLALSDELERAEQEAAALRELLDELWSCECYGWNDDLPERIDAALKP